MIYLDNAATTYPKPPNVVKSVVEAIVDYGGNPGRGGHNISLKASQKIYDTRKKISEMFNCQVQNVVFTSNCTQSLNYAIKGSVKQGDHIILSCLEHNSVIRPIHKLSLDGKITYDIAEFNESIDIITSIKKLINSKTKLVVVTHASNVTGEMMPIYEIAKLCRDNGIRIIIDAAQTAGVFPIDASKFDMVCIAGHKGMYGITSTGILICNTEDIDTIIEGGSGSLSYLFTAPEVLPDRLEAGTLNTVGILSLNAGIEFLKSKKNIEQYEKRLCNYLYESLNKYDNIQFYSPGNTILAFNINNKHSEEVTNFLNEKGFALRGGLQCSPLAHNHYGTSKQGVVRFSPSIFTKEIEVTSLIKNIRQIL